MNSPAWGRRVIRKLSGSNRSSMKSGSVPCSKTSTGCDVKVLVDTSSATGAVLLPTGLTVINWVAVVVLPALSVAAQVTSERLLVSKLAGLLLLTSGVASAKSTTLGAPRSIVFAATLVAPLTSSTRPGGGTKIGPWVSTTRTIWLAETLLPDGPPAVELKTGPASVALQVIELSPRLNRAGGCTTPKEGDRPHSSVAVTASRRLSRTRSKVTPPMSVASRVTSAGTCSVGGCTSNTLID